MANDTLSFGWELRGKLDQQIRAAQEDTKKLDELMHKLGVDINNIPKDVIEKNITKNVNDAEKALYKLFEAKEKLDRSLSRNMSARQNGFLGLDETRLLQSSGRLDEIIDKIMNVGRLAQLSKNAVKDLLTSLSADLAIKDAKGLSSAFDKGLDKQAKDYARIQKDIARDIAMAEKESQNAALRDAAAFERVQDAIAKVATMRANLGTIMEGLSQKEQQQIQFMLGLLDNLYNKLALLKTQNLGERGVLTEPLGAYFKGIMRDSQSLYSQGVSRLKELAKQEEEASKRTAQSARETYQARQKVTQSTRQQAEELVRLRRETLKTQAAELYGTLKKGRGVLDATQYNEVRNALRTVREELRQIEGVMQRMGSYSARDLFGFGRGTSMNYSPLTKYTNDTIAARNAVDMLSDSEMRLVNSLSQTASGLRLHGYLLRDIQLMASQYLSIWGARSFLNNIIETGGLLEQQRLSIGAILGDMDKANFLFGQIKDLALKSPFGVVELDRMSKQLTAYGFQYEELYDWTKRLADISAATGTAVDRLALALGHVRAEGALSGYTLRQFAMGNIPLLQKLAESRNVTTKEIRALVRKKEISDKEVEDVLKGLTNEGGMFYNAQEVMSQALNARLKNLRDSFDIMFGEIAESNVGDFLKELLSSLMSLSRQWERVGLDLVAMASLFIAAKASTYALNSGFIVLNKQLGILGQTTMAYTAEKLKSLAVQGAITREQLLRAVATKRLTVDQARLAAATLGVSETTLQQAAATGKVTKAMLGNAMATSKYTVAQLRLIATLKAQIGSHGIFTGFLLRAKIGVIGLTNAIKTASAVIAGFGKRFLVFAAIMKAIDLFVKRDQEKDDMAEKAKAATDEYLKPLKDIASISETLRDKAPKKLSEYTEAIEQMTDALKSGGRYSDELEEQVNATSSVVEKYQILKNTVDDLSRSYEALAASMEKYLTKAYDTGGSILTDSFGTNVKEAGESLTEYRIAMRTVQRDYVWALRRAVREVYGSIGGEWANKLSAEEIISRLAGEHKFVDVVAELGAIDEKAGDAVKKAFNAKVEAVSDRRTLDRDLPEVAQQIVSAYEESIGKSLDEASAKEKREFIKFAKNTAKNYTESVENQEYVAYAVAKLYIDFDTIMPTQDEINRQILDEWNKMAKDNPLAFYWYEGKMAQFAAYTSAPEKDKPTWKALGFPTELPKMQDAAHMFEDIDYKELAESQSKAIKKIKEIKENLDVTTKMSQNESISGTIRDYYKTQADVLRESYRQAMEVYDFAGFDKKALEDELNKGKNKSNGSKKDEELAKWKERKRAIDEYYKLYQEYAKYLTKEDAIARINKTGLILGQPLPDNIDDYLAVMKAFIDSIKGEINSTERIDFWNMLIGDFDKKEFEQNVSEVTDAALKQLDESLKTQGKQWNLYKKILDVTGDVNQAATIAFGAPIDFKNMAEKLRKDVSDELDKMPDVKERNIDKLLGMDEKELQKNGIPEKSGLVTLLKNLKNAQEQLKEEDAERLVEAWKKLSTIENQIAVVEKKLADARKDYGDNSIEVLALEKELAELRVKEFEESEPYLKFYSAIFSMTASEAEEAGASIKANLADQLSKGAISADKYLKSIKNVDEQLGKMRSHKGVLSAFASGGVKGVLSSRIEVADSNIANAATRVQKADEEVKKAREELAEATKKGIQGEITLAQERVVNAEMAKLDAEEDRKQVEKKRELLGIKKDEVESYNEVIAIIEMFVGAIEGVAKAFQQISEMFDALGKEGQANAWSDAADTVSAIASPLRSNVNAAKSLLNGDIGGAISNTVGIFTSPVTAFAKLHDKKIQRQIEKSQREVKKLTNEYQNLQAAMEKALGGVYTTGGYNEMLDDLKKQREEIQKQYDLEKDKKKSDKNALIDYEQQLVELDAQIRDFALDMANSLYSIDLKSWASELTDAIVTAWENGEDAAEAYRDKVKDIIKTLAKNILAKKVMEKAFSALGIDKYIEDEMVRTDGKLGEGFVERLSGMLIQAGEMTANVITGTMDSLERGGYIERESSSSSSSNSIKSITETTADLLASYVNAIRADVSVNRMTLQQILVALQTQTEMPVIARAQLTQLEQISGNTRRNAESAAMIYNLLHSLAPDGARIRVQ